MAFKQNQASKTFADQVKQLIDRGVVKGFKDVADAIEWDRTAVSNVINGRRNIPHIKYVKFTEVYKFDNPVSQGYKDKYLQLLEQRTAERDSLENYLREFSARIIKFEESHKQLSTNLDRLQNDLRVQAAMNSAYQEWIIEHYGGGNSRKVMNEVRKKAVALLTSFVTKGIGVDMGIVQPR